MTTTTGPLTDCPLTEPHEAGRTRSYTDGCRCPATLTVQRHRNTMEARRRRKQRRGEYTPDRLVDATPSRRHLGRLIRAGHRPSRIVEATGVQLSTLDRIRARHIHQVRESTARKILSFKGDPAATVYAGEVPALATMRRLRALAAAGHSTGAVAALAPIPPGTKNPATYRRTRANRLTRIRLGIHTGTSPAIEADTARAYDQLWDQAPPKATRHDRSNLTCILQLAQREGWLPPMYWDDDRMGDPTYTPRIPFDARYGDTPNG